MGNKIGKEIDHPRRKQKHARLDNKPPFNAFQCMASRWQKQAKKGSLRPARLVAAALEKSVVFACCIKRSPA